MKQKSRAKREVAERASEKMSSTEPKVCGR